MIATRTLRRARVLIVGCGDIGLRCAALLRSRARVFALTSQPVRVATLREAGTIPMVGDLDVPANLTRLAGLASVVLHLAPPQQSGDEDTRTRRLIAALTARRRAAARPAGGGRRALRTDIALSPRLRMSVPTHDTRPNALSGPLRPAFGPRATHLLARRKASSIVPERTAGPRRTHPGRLTVVYASTTGVYGDCAGARIDETRPVRPANARAKRRVAAEHLLRRATTRGSLVTKIARIPGIYAADRLPLARLAKGTPALVERDDVYTNHIHADDLAAIMVRLATHGRPGRVIHASDDSELKMGEWFDRVADAFGVARAPRVSRAEAERQLDPVLLSFMRESRRLANGRLKWELGIRLRYPDVDDFLRTLPPRP
ncbi:NAD-dependent epimerase/dehydratase family protein [Paraburkholderia dinghuensis]|uniref:SDR family NAD(P)-dependent oxidoreductase n=1 Tax=Paraburkholderia dinghuensis TaxID=2305225 RepID=A0A3N6QB59_9BURK|nr:NAD-dependent epimerase/dehydratase family protein [Paraburkholderia dinghuensis]RQH09856.1 SDR family NAD(P)-dependent oxidoreductase [Paraburkholderia dinghuensis]